MTWFLGEPKTCMFHGFGGSWYTVSINWCIYAYYTFDFFQVEQHQKSGETTSTV